MIIISDNNKFLDELEAMAERKPFTLVAVRQRSLTLKSPSDYFEKKRVVLDFTGDREVETITAASAENNQEIALDSPIARFVKRCCDFAGALVGLILTSPLWIIIPVLIKVDSRGPVFYSQTRVGRNRRENRRRLTPQSGAGNSRQRERRRDNSYGETFRVLKFRTMVHGAENESGPVWAVLNDIRITRVGSILRKLRLDEIPQFLNVLAGDMSLVGPRPERPSFVREFSDKMDSYNMRLEVKPGITGLAQIRGTYDSSHATVAEKLKYDLAYIETWSLWLDFKILLKTIWVVLTCKGAH